MTLRNGRGSAVHVEETLRRVRDTSLAFEFYGDFEPVTRLQIATAARQVASAHTAHSMTMPLLISTSGYIFENTTP
jgi:hypothetical protein